MIKIQVDIKCSLFISCHQKSIYSDVITMVAVCDSFQNLQQQWDICLRGTCHVVIAME